MGITRDRVTCVFCRLQVERDAHTVRVSTLCHQHGLHLGSSTRSTCYDISCVPNFLNYFPTVITATTIINDLRRRRQSVAFPTRSSSRYSTPFDNPSNVMVTTRELGTATKAGSSSHMYAENGDRLCSHHLHDYTYSSASRSIGLQERL